MQTSQAKQHVFLRVIGQPDPPPLRVLATALGVDPRTLRNWRRKQREAIASVRDDSAHCLKILDRA